MPTSNNTTTLAILVSTNQFLFVKYSVDVTIASNIHSPPTHLTYPTSHPGNPQSSTPPVPRFRAASSAYPSGLDLRSQYRAVSTQGPNHGVPATARTAPFASAFSSGGFQSAPLIASAEFQIPRTPNDAGPRDYHMSQLSAPMAPPQDFSATYGQSASPARRPATEHSTLGRQHDSTGLQDQQNRQNQQSPQDQQDQQSQQDQQDQQQQQQHHHHHQGETTQYLRQDEYDLSSGTKGRKRTYSMSAYEGQ